MPWYRPLDLLALPLQARDIIARDPSLLEFQMEERVRPRLEAMRAAGVGDVDMGAPLSVAGKLKILGKSSESRFAKWLRRESQAKLEREKQEEEAVAATAATAGTAGTAESGL